MGLYLGNTRISGVRIGVTGSGVILQQKTATPSKASQVITPDSGYTGLANVTISAIPDEYIIPTGTLEVTKNGTANVTQYSSINVQVPTQSGSISISLQDKTIDPSTSIQTVTADSTYDGLGTVTVNAMTTMTLPTSTTTSSLGTRKATVGRSTSTRYINIPIGYNSTAAYYQISAVADGTVIAPSTISGTGATVSNSTNTLTLTKTISVTPTVSTAGYVSAGTANNSTITLSATVTTKGAYTYTPNTQTQTIAKDTYLTGVQTISGDANLVGENILSGKTIFGVAGTVIFANYYTGTTVPSDSTGSNGDIYLQE